MKRLWEVFKGSLGALGLVLAAQLIMTLPICAKEYSGFYFEIGGGANVVIGGGELSYPLNSLYFGNITYQSFLSGGPLVQFAAGYDWEPFGVGATFYYTPLEYDVSHSYDSVSSDVAMTGSQIDFRLFPLVWFGIPKGVVVPYLMLSPSIANFSSKGDSAFNMPGGLAYGGKGSLGLQVNVTEHIYFDLRNGIRGMYVDPDEEHPTYCYGPCHPRAFASHNFEIWSYEGTLSAGLRF